MSSDKHKTQQKGWLYENCNYVLTKEKTINNMNHMTECKEKINSYMDSHIKPINEEKTNVLDMIKEREE